MTRVLFVCLGNICRSPMAEMIFKDMIKKNNLEQEFFIDSAGTSYEEDGNPIHYGARDVLTKHDIHIENHKARRIQKDDYDKFDYIIAMEEVNVYNVMRIIGQDPHNKVSRLLDFTDNPRDIEDPWYSGKFEKTFSDIKEGCEALFNYLRK